MWVFSPTLVVVSSALLVPALQGGHLSTDLAFLLSSQITRSQVFAVIVKVSAGSTRWHHLVLWCRDEARHVLSNWPPQGRGELLRQTKTSSQHSEKTHTKKNPYNIGFYTLTWTDFSPSMWSDSTSRIGQWGKPRARLFKAFMSSVFLVMPLSVYAVTRRYLKKGAMLWQGPIFPWIIPAVAPHNRKLRLLLYITLYAL